MNIKNINEKAVKYKSNSKDNFKRFSHKKLMNLPPYNGILEFAINNINFEMLNVNNDDGIVTKYFWRDEYEALSTKLWSNLSKKNSIFIDVGSHTGIYSIIGNLSNIKNITVSIEPYFLNYARLLTNLRLNNIPTINCFCYAVLNTPGLVNFKISTNNYYHTMGGKVEETGDLKVKALTLDNLKFDNTRKKIEAIKIDTEGSEDKVLEGSKKLINKNKPDFLIEYNKNSYEKCLKILEQYNYSFYFLDDNNKKLIAREDFESNKSKYIGKDCPWPKEGTNFYCTKKTLNKINALIS